MGLVITKVYWPNIHVPVFDGARLDDYSRDWRRALAHQNVRLLKSEKIGDYDVLIVEHPVYVPASSAFGVVATVSWSLLNPDFTEESRTVSLQDLKARLDPVVASGIVPGYFGDCIGTSLGFNVWLQRLDGAFIVVHTKA